MTNHTQLYLSARSPAGATIADALDAIPSIDAELRAIGWRRPLEELIGDAEFVNDICAYGFTPTEAAAKEAIRRLASLLDRHAEAVATDHIALQAWHVSESMDQLVRGATLQWSRKAVLQNRSLSSRVTLLRPAWARA